MRCKTILVALLALAFQAQAAHVSQSEAAGAASVWAGAGKALGSRLGASVKSVREHAVTNGYSFYAVKLDRGTVIMTSDTDIEPVIAFTPNGDIDLSEGSLALDLLRKDVALRAALVGGTAGGSSPSRRTSAAVGASPVATPAATPRPGAALWSALLSASKQASQSAGPSRRLSAESSAKPVDSVSDVRVAPFVQSKWSQTTVDDTSTSDLCYNYYTPNNYPCGCTATAMAQIMRYLEFPATEVEPQEFDCEVGGRTTTLMMQGGLYDWGSMTLVPKYADTLEEENRQAIGKLTSDIGIALKSSYAADETGADPQEVAAVFRDVFGYSDAICYFSEDALEGAEVGLHRRDLRTRTILANLDAGQPVLLAIYGYNSFGGWAGHAVVADGYGYQNVAGVETEFVHINMGWSGKDDMWYNIPVIDAANTGAQASDTGTTFLYLGGAIFNVSSEDTGLSILSGRTTDDDGAAISGALVNAYDADGYLVGETISDENGIYFFKLPGDAAYYLEATSPDGKCIADLVVENLPATKDLDASYCVYVDSNVGNSWGNDMVLAPPSVRVGDLVFASLDSAIKMARAVAVPDTPVSIEILDVTKLRMPTVIDFKCSIVATNSDPAASLVQRRAGAMLTVADDAVLVISNVVFSSGASTLVDVAAGGQLALAGIVDFGVPYNVPAVRTASASGLLVYGGLERGFTLDCAAATAEGEAFGYALATQTAAFEAICASVAHIANYYDETGEVRGYVTGSSPIYSIVWRRQAVPVEDCVGYFVDAEGKTNTAGRIDRLFDMYSAALEGGRLGDERRIVILESGTLSRPLVVEGDTSIVGDGVDIALDPSAGFTVTGGELSVSGMTLSGYVGNALFMVNGEDASLALGPGLALRDIEGTNRWSGAVAVLDGSASATGATFTNCVATASGSRSRNSYGGAVYMAAGTSLSLEDVTIIDCHARNYGGGVYAEEGAVVSLAGAMNVSGNVSGPDASHLKQDDIYLKNSKNGRASLYLEGDVSGSVGVRWQGKYDGLHGNDSGLLLAEAASAAVAHASAAAFFSDVSAEVVAEPDDDAVALRWTDAPKGPQPWEGDPDEASARVEYDNGETEYYLLVTEAFEAVSGDATIYVQGWNGTEISSEIVVSHAITLASDLDVGLFELLRVADCSIVVEQGASLTLRDIGVYGSAVDELDVLGETVPVPELYAARPLFDVRGGSLVLDTPTDEAGSYTEVGDVYGGYGDEYLPGARNAGAVSVWQGGNFTMRSGTGMAYCCNYYANPSDGSGRGGAVLVDDGEAIFEGGTISDCTAYTGGGVFVGNYGTISISGDTVIDGNYNAYGYDNNLVVHDLGKLTLAGKMTGSIGYTEGDSGDKVVFGKVAEGVSEADALESAHNFTHDLTGDVGMAVSRDDVKLLVWSAGLDAEGKYSDDEGIYSLVNGDPYRIEVPAARTDLVYSGEEQAGVPDGVGYTVENGSATNAGDYTAAVTLKAGFAWDDGTTSAKTVDWSIAKAQYDMSGVSFDDMTVSYGGQYFELVVTGELPDGVTVSYENNRQSEVGVYAAVASFSGDADNYEPIDDMTATLTIVAIDEPTPPSGEDPAQPLPVAFTAILDDGGNWTLSLETAVEKCWYFLYETNSISGGFDIEDVGPVEVRQATSADVPTMTFERPSSGEQLFWKVVAEPEDAR